VSGQKGLRVCLKQVDVSGDRAVEGVHVVIQTAGLRGQQRGNIGVCVGNTRRHGRSLGVVGGEHCGVRSRDGAVYAGDEVAGVGADAVDDCLPLGVS